MSADNQLTVLLEIIISTILGGIIGIERELAQKPAGMRTHMLVAGATTFLVAMGDALMESYAIIGYKEYLGADPFRIMGAIVVGLSFVGGGAIIQNTKEDRVEGLTTASSLLFVGSIGIGVGLEQYYLSAGSTLLVLLINRGLFYFEEWLIRNYGKSSKKENKEH